MGDARLDAESGDARDDAQAEVNPEREFDAYGGVGPARKSHGEEGGSGGSECGKRHVPGIDFNEVFAFDHFLHDAELGGGKDGEEHAVEAEQSVGDPFRARHVAHDNRDDGSEHAHR